MRWLAGAATALTATIILGAWVTWPHGTAPVNVLLEAGYLEIVPPSKLNGPGTIITLELIDHGKVQLHPTCETDAFSELLTKKFTSRTPLIREVLQSIKKQLDVSEKIKGMLASDAAINVAKSISLSFANAHILLMTDEGLMSIQKALLRDACEEAVTYNLSNGGIVCQTRSVLEADATYEIKYNDEVSADEQARFSSIAAAKLAMVANQDSTNRISGRRLFYGVKLAPIFWNTPDAKPMNCAALPLS